MGDRLISRTTERSRSVSTVADRALKRLSGVLSDVGCRLCWLAESLRPKGPRCEDCGTELEGDECPVCDMRSDEEERLVAQYDGGYVDGYTEAYLRAEGER